MNMDCILVHYVHHKPVDLSLLTTTGEAAGCIILFLPSHHFSPYFLGTCVHYYYICNVKHLNP